MRRIMFAAMAATLLAGSTGCGALDWVLVGPTCGTCGTCDGGPTPHEPQLLEESLVAEEGDCCDSGCNTCGPCPLFDLLSSLNPCHWGCGQPCDDGECGDCGLLGFQGLFGCCGDGGCGGLLFGGWGCGECYFGNFWGSSCCDPCDQYGGWNGETDSYYPRHSTVVEPAEPVLSPESINNDPAPIESDVKPMPVDDLTPDAVEGTQTRQSNSKVFRQTRSSASKRTNWKSRRPR